MPALRLMTTPGTSSDWQYRNGEGFESSQLMSCPEIRTDATVAGGMLCVNINAARRRQVPHQEVVNGFRALFFG